MNVNIRDERLIAKLPQYAQNWEILAIDGFHDGNYANYQMIFIDHEHPERENTQGHRGIFFNADSWNELLWFVRNYKKTGLYEY